MSSENYEKQEIRLTKNIVNLRDGFSDDLFAKNEKQIESNHIILHIGEFNQGGNEFEVTTANLKAMVDNFRLNVLGTEPPVDFSHNSEELAAGWITELSLSSGGEELIARIRWTPAGIEQIEKRQFRFLSPSFSFEFFDGTTGESFGPVLRGAGLTNIPFLRRLSPIVDLSDVAGKNKEVKSKEGAKTMSKDKDIDTTISLADHKAQTKVFVDQINGLQGEVKTLNDRVKELEPLGAKNTELGKEVATLKGEKEIAQKETEFQVLLSEGKAVAAQKEAYMTGDMNEFIKLTHAVNLSAKGSHEKVSDGIVKFSELNEKEKKFFHDNVVDMSEEEYVYFRDGKTPPKKDSKTVN